MSEINVDGCRIHAEVEGSERAPVLVLSYSLATTLHMWDPQVSAITQHFRLVRYDPRGHGLSDVPAGPYTMERLGRDALAILDSLRINKVSWCGLSMGGMVGQWLATNPTFLSNSIARCSAALRGCFSTLFGPAITLPSAVLCGNSSKFWNTMPIRWRTRRMPFQSFGRCSPSSVISPLSISSRPLVQRSRVDFPEPEGPMRQTTSPLRTSIETPASATKSPNRFFTSR